MVDARALRRADRSAIGASGRGARGRAARLGLRLRGLRAPRGRRRCVLLLDRVTDPHNVGAILRSAEVFGAPRGDRAPSPFRARDRRAVQDRLRRAGTPALSARAQSRQRHGDAARHGLRHPRTRRRGRHRSRGTAIASFPDRPLALVLGAEGPGLRMLTGKLCDRIVRIPAAGRFGSLNVSNAAAVGLYAVRAGQGASG